MREGGSMKWRGLGTEHRGKRLQEGGMELVGMAKKHLAQSAKV